MKNTTTPKRTQRTAYIASTPIKSLPTIESWRSIPKEVNAMLALCEIIMSLPPSWFTQEERIATVTVVTELYGSPHKFLDDISAGHVSFVNKVIPSMGRVDKIVLEAIFEHAAEFGTLEM